MVIVLYTTTHSTSSRATDISLVRDYNCNLSLQFRNASFDKLAFDSRERVGRIIRPALLKTLSLAAELAETLKIFHSRGLRALNRLSCGTSRPRPETGSSDKYSEYCCLMSASDCCSGVARTLA